MTWLSGLRLQLQQRKCPASHCIMLILGPISSKHTGHSDFGTISYRCTTLFLFTQTLPRLTSMTKVSLDS